MIQRWAQSLLVLPLLAALSIQSAHAELQIQADDCEYIESELAELDADDLLELAFEPECAALRSAALDLAETRLAENAQALSDVRAEGIEAADHAEALAELREQKQGLDLLLIRRALDMGDVGQAQRRVEALLAAPRPVQAEDEEDDETLMGLKEELEAVQSILSGRAAVQGFALQIAAPSAEWRLSFGWCGTPAAMFDTLSRDLPTRAAAWRALGQPRMAFETLLETYWIDALSFGRLPPQIREYADAAFGPGAFDAELERGLQQIWIEPGVEGRYAYLPLFGRRLPLPLGYRSLSIRRANGSEPDSQTKLFQNADEIATYLRRRVLSDE